MEDTLIRLSDKIKDDGEIVNVDEDNMIPTVKSLVVPNWLDADANKGPVLVELRSQGPVPWLCSRPGLWRT